MIDVYLTVPTSDLAQDTASAAYVTKPSGPPDNSSFMYGAYAVAIAIYAAYIVLMMRRISHARREADRRHAPTGTDASRRER